MKRLTNLLLPVSFDGLDLSHVESIRFVFVQDKTRLLFDYPSSSATLGEDNTILLRWSADQTAKFQSGLPMKMDTLVKLSGVEQNPPTPIVTITMDPTLFLPEEVAHD